MNRPGEMDVLADIVRPDLALITNIGTAHIGLLGSRDAIAAEKKKVFAHFDGRQTAFIPGRTPYRAFLAEGGPGQDRPLRAGKHPGLQGKREQGTGWNDHPLGGVPYRLPALRPAQPRQRPRGSLRGARAGRPERGNPRRPSGRRSAVRAVPGAQGTGDGHRRLLQCESRLHGKRALLRRRAALGGKEDRRAGRHARAGR